MKSQVQYSKTQLSLLLIQCQISIKLFGESITSVYVRTSLSVDKILQTASSQVDCLSDFRDQSIKSLTYDDLRMFALTRLPVTQ